MSWNYRIVCYADGSGYGLHEVHYNEDGGAWSMTRQPAGFVGDTAEDVRGSMMLAFTDAKRRPVFMEPAAWAPRRTAPKEATGG